MKSQGYYLSVPLDPWREDNDIDSLDVTQNGLLQYKRDSIVNKIGESDCHEFINLYIKELKEELDEQKFRDFFADCVQKIMEQYYISNFEFFINYYVDSSYDNLYGLLKFLELSGWEDLLSKILPRDPDILVYDDKELKKYIKDDIKEIKKKLKRYKNYIPNILYSALVYISNDELIKFLRKLIKKDKQELVSKMLEEKEND